jgi:hypothetical protein
VSAVARLYAGERFDGMIDMAYSVSHWLLPDGTVQLTSSPRSEGKAMKVLEGWKAMQRGPYVFFSHKTGDHFKDVKGGLK